MITAKTFYFGIFLKLKMDDAYWWSFIGWEFGFVGPASLHHVQSGEESSARLVEIRSAGGVVFRFGWVCRLFLLIFYFKLPLVNNCLQRSNYISDRQVPKTNDRAHQSSSYGSVGVGISSSFDDPVHPVKIELLVESFLPSWAEVVKDSDSIGKCYFCKTHVAGSTHCFLFLQEGLLKPTLDIFELLILHVTF